MLRITSEQFAIFEAISQRKFIDDAVRILLERCAEEATVLGEESVRKMINEMISRSCDFGVVFRDDVLIFIEMELRHGPRFFENCGWAQNILNRPHVDGSYKVDQLIEAEIFAK